MKVIISDLSKEWNTALADSCDELFNADGRYAPCQGCFGCWTKHPVLYYILRMGISVNRKKSFGKKYTRILIPSFVFILFADTFLSLSLFYKAGFLEDGSQKRRHKHENDYGETVSMLAPQGLPAVFSFVLVVYR